VIGLPVQPPVAPMLARLEPALPRDDHFYEPKWDGFRALAFRDGDWAELQSRNLNRFGRYFPELIEALRQLRERRFVLDGEILVVGARGFDFEALLKRIHPAASRVDQLREETPARLVVFDLLALGDENLMDRPFAERRARLEELLAGAPPAVVETPITEDAGVASSWLGDLTGRGIDGVVAKPRNLPYVPGKRMMVKVKPEHTADCVVAGFRVLPDGGVASLLLGLYDGEGRLRHVGVSSSFTGERRRALFADLRPLTTSLAGHPWERGFGIERRPLGRLRGAAGVWTPDMSQDWVPVKPALVCEVAYDQVDIDRFRHPARFRRWRPDRAPESCRLDQLRPV
jgi:ATP-dependent DNA ligase